MSTIAIVLLVIPIAVATYAYLGYPVLLALVARKSRRGAMPEGVPLPVTIVIPAYNEEAQIRGAIEAAIAQDYPEECRQILIISDGSTDRTDDVVREYASQGVELLRMPKRSGKTAAENASVAHLRGEIIINTDASIRLHRSAIRHLVATFADPRVGVASTRDVSVAKNVHANVTEAGYVGYEMWIRSLETRAGGIVGASGSGYAIRTNLHRFPVRADLSRDFSAALTARAHGYRAVSVDEAISFVPRTTSLRSEYRRKVRTISRGMETLLFNRRMLNPRSHGLFAWKLISHKLFRWLLPLTLLPAIAGLGLLASSHSWPRFLLLGAAVMLLIAAIGARWPEHRPMPRAVSVVAFAVAANLAVVQAVWRVVRGHDDHMWEPTRRTPDASARHESSEVLR